MAHIHGYPDNEAEWLDMLLGRGKGDPDMQAFYPGEEASQANPKASHQHQDATTSDSVNHTFSTTKKTTYIGVKKKL
jgi:hypothetical protein